MTNDQFDALAALARLREGPAKEAARLILVSRMPPSVAARRAGCSPQSASNTHTRCQVALALAHDATGAKPSP